MNAEELIDELRITALAQSRKTVSLKKRFAFEILQKRVTQKPRIKLVKGFRGVGKTTLLLQLFTAFKDRAFYFSADSPILKETSIYGLGKELYKKGHTLILIDEIHTYLHWKKEIKALNDECPDLVIIASGSAPLALVPERRDELLEILPMNFNEYLFLKTDIHIHSEKEWMDSRKSIEFMGEHNLNEETFKNYIQLGGFPFFLEMKPEAILNAVYYSINKSIKEDAVFFLKMSKEKVFGMEKLLVLLATSPPGELNITSMSSNLQLSKTTVYEIIYALNQMQIIRIIKPYKKGAPLVRSEPKILFTHPNLRTALCAQLGIKPEWGALREEIALFAFSQRGWKNYTIKGMKKSPDYVIEKGKKRFVIEIGGAGKTGIQLKGFENSLILTERQLLTLALI